MRCPVGTTLRRVRGVTMKFAVTGKIESAKATPLCSRFRRRLRKSRAAQKPVGGPGLYLRDRATPPADACQRSCHPDRCRADAAAPIVARRQEPCPVTQVPRQADRNHAHPVVTAVWPCRAAGNQAVLERRGARDKPVPHRTPRGHPVEVRHRPAHRRGWRLPAGGPPSPVVGRHDALIITVDPED